MEKESSKLWTTLVISRVLIGVNKLIMNALEWNYATCIRNYVMLVYISFVTDVKQSENHLEVFHVEGQLFCMVVTGNLY